ncbi:MAG: hypothetical protein M5R36_28975 [Deltaproteobacteria bacterium]|nr:hypothetical protein [Deltaproteobacteria bacterium]
MRRSSCGRLPDGRDAGRGHPLSFDLDESDIVLTTDRDTGADGAQDGEGTHPAVGAFAVWNLDPGAYLFTVDVDGAQTTSYVPPVEAGSVVLLVDHIYPYPDFTANPTGAWCTE